MIEVTSFMSTTGSEKFKEFLAKPFTIDMLYPIYNDKSCKTLFDGWKGKNMINWYKFTNEDKYVLEFYPDSYLIKRSRYNYSYQMNLPKSINDFINDAERFNIQLYWTNWIDENFEPKEYLHKEKIYSYFLNLLGKMGKSNELN